MHKYFRKLTAGWHRLLTRIRKNKGWAAIVVIAAFVVGVAEFKDAVVSIWDSIASLKTKATEDVAEIAHLKKEVERQRDELTVILRDANDARVQIAAAKEGANRAHEKAEHLETLIRKADVEYQRLRELADFNLALSQANNEDREAFDRLRKHASGGREPFKTLATQALTKIVTDRFALAAWEVDFTQRGFNPAEASLDAFRAQMRRNQPSDLPSFLNQFWKQDRFAKRDRLHFLAEVINSTKSLKALNTACLLMEQEAKLGRNVIAWDLYLGWWDINQSKY